ncbi:MAG: winged helix-turn-helix domain-containing protein [Candidatus Thorarchaeota archaeon]|nr:MAG: winged helix-turn-helix domain-containing protein [Candidatus Thorarchaeota archaeon]
MIEITVEDARRFVLDVQGLRTNKQCKSVLDVANRIHNIQIDTISVVSRSHNLITFNRFPKYKEGEIWEHEKNGKLFEFWSHAMCLMPMESYPFYTWRRKFYPGPRGKKWALEHKDTLKQVYRHVKKNGVTNSASIGERKTDTTGWWDWKVEKRALEHLYTQGKLMVAYRKGFQKYYDLTERVLPDHVDSEPITDEEAAEFIIDSSLGSLGVGCYDDIRTYHNKLPSQKIWNGRKEQIESFLDQRVKDGHLVEIAVANLSDRYFAIAKTVDNLQTANFFDSDNAPVRFLTPFDNILRERLFPKRIWNFDYKIECYVPAPDRVYGYFVLPILDRTDLAGRLDAKAHRKTGILEIKALYLENKELQSSQGLDRLKRGIVDFADFHSCEKIEVGKVRPRNLTHKIRSQFK